MDNESKERLTKIMESIKPGLVGLLAMDIESTITSVPAPRIAVLMAMEIVVEAAARHAKKHPNPETGDTFEKGREVSSLVREYIQGLSDEDFDRFTSDESMREVTEAAMEKMREMGMHSCQGCGACHEDEDEGEDPDKLVN